MQHEHREAVVADVDRVREAHELGRLRGRQSATGVAVYNSGSWTVVGGTSAASPLVAGIFALTKNGSRTSQFIYQNTTAFHDVTSGTNGSCGNVVCSAGTGWDGPTGVGTPNGARSRCSAAAPADADRAVARARAAAAHPAAVGARAAAARTWAPTAAAPAPTGHRLGRRHRRGSNANNGDGNGSTAAVRPAAPVASLRSCSRSASSYPSPSLPEVSRVQSREVSAVARRALDSRSAGALATAGHAGALRSGQFTGIHSNPQPGSVREAGKGFLNAARMAAALVGFLKTFGLAMRLQSAEPDLLVLERVRTCRGGGGRIDRARRTRAAARDRVRRESLRCHRASRVKGNRRRAGRYPSMTPPANLNKRRSMYCGPLQTFAGSWAECISLRDPHAATPPAPTTRALASRQARARRCHPRARRPRLRQPRRDTGKCNFYPQRVLWQQRRFAMGLRARTMHRSRRHAPRRAASTSTRAATAAARADRVVARVGRRDVQADRQRGAATQTVGIVTSNGSLS